MHFRYARHTDNLKPIIEFYTNVMGLQILGRFDNHANYSGVFLGFPNQDWHLEFTQSDQKAEHKPDDDDLLVLYVGSTLELNAILAAAKKHGSMPTISKNPYWQTNGIELKDPDNFGVVISIKQRTLMAQDSTTLLLRKSNITTWEQLLIHIQSIPYGRNADRANLELVLTENKGTCSSKHALVKQIGDSNQIESVSLILCMYQMTEANTKGIGTYLSDHDLDYIPEAHCFLMINGKRIDLTNPNSDMSKLEAAILEEKEIMPYQVDQYKVDYHKAYIANWAKKMQLMMSLEALWSIREKCIAHLAQSTPE